MKKNNSESALEPTVNSLQARRSRLSFIYAVPIGILGGLIGLGGAEFRLPVLARNFGLFSTASCTPEPSC